MEDLNQGHHQTKLCQRGWERKRQHVAVVRSQQALEHVFTCNKEPLERVEVFKYLGRLIAGDDADTQAMRLNLRKARGVWARVSRVLRAENASPWTSGMFYKAIVQAVLLYGSETWSLLPLSLKGLEGFHIRAAWRMSGLTERVLDLPSLGRCVIRDWPGNNFPLYGCSLADCCKLYSEPTNL